MHHKLLLVTLLSSALLLTGCSPTASQQKPDQSEAEAKSGEQASEGGMESIIKNIASGQSYRCTFAEKNTTNKMEYSIRGKQVSARMTTMTEDDGQQIARIIADEPYFYWWDEATKQGMKMTSTELSDQAPGQPSVPDFNDLEAWNALQDTYTYNCQPGGVKDSDFVVPSDVKLTDLSEMMQGIMPQ